MLFWGAGDIRTTLVLWASIAILVPVAAHSSEALPKRECSQAFQKAFNGNGRSRLPRLPCVAHGDHDKVKIFKMRRRKHYQKHQGHRQNYTEIKIVSING